MWLLHKCGTMPRIGLSFQCNRTFDHSLGCAAGLDLQVD